MNQEVNNYIVKQEKSQKEILTTLRVLIKSLVPQAEEKMSYGVPAFTLNNKSVLYAAFKTHYGIYPGPDIINEFKDDLKNYQSSKGTIKFSLEKPIPTDLISKIVLKAPCV
ncbi:MAG TPA: DUF1801 domain-containing protein [Candidatus Methanoperedens sp.]|nr:DUF1801 domain-containing protein [Candidatus Methanoperedens sp.]